ncbi:YIP1 family protein [Sphingopyxis indica]|uniref:Yip1 family protein n=1 Tax=Sphingopyxis indica TaxID=436663 RepID=UPI002938E0B5|nr:Yip1 family protein [Sphingopyxis indica]WOF41714.1 YIP1 family protein [Sphingopyxis indica]
MTDESFRNPTPPEESGQAIVQRAKDILLKPKETWAVIDGEAATVQSLYVPYVLVLAAIGPLAGLIGGQLFGYRFLNVTYHPPLAGALVSAVLSYAMTLAAVYIVALVIDALAPTFDGQQSRIQALKVAVYSATAGWVAGIFNLIPGLFLLAMLAGLYSLYLLYLGLPRLMKTPQDKAIVYTAVVVVVTIVCIFAISAIVGLLAVQGNPAFGGSL